MLPQQSPFINLISIKITRDLAVFEKFNVRKHFDEKNQKWFFLVIDIVAVLTDQHDYGKAKTYWTTLI